AALRRDCAGVPPAPAPRTPQNVRPITRTSLLSRPPPSAPGAPCTVLDTPGPLNRTGPPGTTFSSASCSRAAVSLTVVVPPGSSSYRPPGPPWYLSPEP